MTTSGATNYRQAPAITTLIARASFMTQKFCHPDPSDGECVAIARINLEQMEAI